MTINLPAIVTIPAHPFEPAKRASDAGLIADPRCGYHHRLSDDESVWCAFGPGHPVHGGQDTQVRVREWTDEEIERDNR
ncbi:hypothetical protein AMIS_21240 [Actinoplanes missouriensis 431]|uniref:Uncharacterized protein n=1 Tax=Actinoplanes missouriensis (strain ATCC 14538 / DSM 43046 / CBS 188.64 / JCM 3121 / NBRC 102363 / NCIMB 12654 / NRRL B-3342 / UNCC 431) TaxID=512565 RepID=I0H2V7_ACTM4|nr:hypothetical protein [Actinoplanes missouriensis]BAL87344.1 hypothetical protein AMIS_21240 [Actinoplanes missouriensis 431]